MDPATITGLIAAGTAAATTTASTVASKMTRYNVTGVFLNNTDAEWEIIPNTSKPLIGAWHTPPPQSIIALVEEIQMAHIHQGVGNSDYDPKHFGLFALNGGGYYCNTMACYQASGLPGTPCLCFYICNNTSGNWSAGVSLCKKEDLGNMANGDGADIMWRIQHNSTNSKISVSYSPNGEAKTVSKTFGKYTFDVSFQAGRETIFSVNQSDIKTVGDYYVDLKGNLVDIDPGIVLKPVKRVSGNVL